MHTTYLDAALESHFLFIRTSLVIRINNDAFAKS